MIFIDNKYTKWYNSIINKAKNRIIDGYTEKHHIIPRSLGGQDTKDNLVEITAKEHFICHMLLVKMVEGKSRSKMSYALWLMCNLKNQFQPNRYLPSSNTYEQIRVKHSLIVSANLRGISKTYSSFKGKKHSVETIELQRELKRGQRNPNFGVVQKQEWNEKKSKSQKGILKPKLICSVCNKTVGGHGNLERWHESNCTLNKIS